MQQSVEGQHINCLASLGGQEVMVKIDGIKICPGQKWCQCLSFGCFGSGFTFSGNSVGVNVCKYLSTWQPPCSCGGQTCFYPVWHSFTQMCDILGEVSTLWDISGEVCVESLDSLTLRLTWEQHFVHILGFHPLLPVKYIQEAQAAFSGHLVRSSQCEGCKQINVRAHVAPSLSLASQHCNWVELVGV